MKNLQLLSIFSIIRELNPEAVITGSLALYLQRIDLRNAPSDLDIHMPLFMVEEDSSGETIPTPYHWVFKLPPGFKAIDGTYVPVTQEIWRKSYSYEYEDVFYKIDVFQRVSHFSKELDCLAVDPNIYELRELNLTNVFCTFYTDIIKFKLEYALKFESLSSEKHSKDILYILLNNTELKYLSFNSLSQSLFANKLTKRNEKFHETFNLTRPIVFFDVETTGVNPSSDRIIELSVIKIKPDGGQEEIRQLFNPQMNIPIEASKIHNIFDHDVANAPLFQEKAEEFSDFFSNCDVGGYNILAYDVPIIVEEFLRAHVKLPFNISTKYIDSLKLFYHYEKRDLTSAYKFYCEKKMKGAHAAEVDNLATIEIFLKQVERYNLPKDLLKIQSLIWEIQKLQRF